MAASTTTLSTAARAAFVALLSGAAAEGMGTGTSPPTRAAFVASSPGAAA